jgi:hypothetical protein
MSGVDQEWQRGIIGGCLRHRQATVAQTSEPKGSEYLDIRAASPGPFKTAESAGLVKAMRQDNTSVVFIEPGASEVLSLVTEFREKLALLNALSLVVVGDRPKIRQ